MSRTWDRFSELVKQHHALLGADAFLERYSKTLMPPGEKPIIEFQRQVLDEVARETISSSEMGALLRKLENQKLSGRRRAAYEEFAQTHPYNSGFTSEPQKQTTWDRFDQLVQRNWALTATQTDLEYYQRTRMRKSERRAIDFQIVTLDPLADEVIDSDEMRELISQLRAARLDWDQRVIYRGAVKEYNETTRIPAKYRDERARLLQESGEIWPKARRKADFGMIQPTLEKIVKLDRKAIMESRPGKDIYEGLALWDDTFTIGDLDNYSRALQTHISPLIHAIGKNNSVDDSFLRRSVSPNKSKELQMWLLNVLGFDFKLGRVDEAEHPEASGSNFAISKRVRTLGRVIETLGHEAGHAIYDQKLPRVPIARYFGPLGTSYSMNLEEGIAYIYENHIGKSRAFWKFHLLQLRRMFPNLLKDVDLDTFYRAMNKVKPGFSSTYSDEVTGIGHILLKVNTERKVGEGSLLVKDVPNAYNKGMQEILGITPPNDRLGVLATSHLYDGPGNYSQYLFAPVIGSQLAAAMKRDIPEISDRMRGRQIKKMNEWLRENIYRHGSRYTTKELVKMATGKPPGPEDYINYLYKKFGRLYELPIEMHNGIYRLRNNGLRNAA